MLWCLWEIIGIIVVGILCLGDDVLRLGRKRRTNVCPGRWLKRALGYRFSGMYCIEASIVLMGTRARSEALSRGCGSGSLEINCFSTISSISWVTKKNIS